MLPTSDIPSSLKGPQEVPRAKTATKRENEKVVEMARKLVEDLKDFMDDLNSDSKGQNLKRKKKLRNKLQILKWLI